MRRFVGLGTAIFLLGAAAPATAATITVTVTFDDQFAGDGQCSLRKAINDVNSPGSSQTDCAPAAFGANTIVLDAQRYLLGGSFPPGAGQLTIAPTVKNLSITGAGVNATTIDAASLNNRVFSVSGGATVTIAGLKIINGAAPAGATGSAGAAGATGSNGGAIFNQGGLTLNDAAVTNSHAGNGGGGGAGSGASGGDGGAGGSGGAIYNAASGNLTLNGVTIGNDFAGSGGNGGAGANSGAAGTTGGNGGPAGTGGGIENAGGSLTVVDSTVRGDLAGNGGSGGGGGSGTATGGNGGAGGAGANGGGISNDSGSLSVSNGTFASNFAGGGGTGGNGGPGGSAAGGDGGSGGAGGSGGGIAAATPANASLLQATVAGNNAGSGGAGGGGGTGSPNGAGGSAGGAGSTGGVFDQGSAITLRNSLLSINGGGNCAGAILDGGFNLSSGDSSCPATFASGDPNLGPLQDNGGPAPTIALQPGSAAINQIPASGANCPPSDERGAPRPAGSGGAKCDIGAYEVVPPVAITGAATNVSLTGATLVGSVTPYAGSAGVVFQYGTTTKYGQTTPLQHIGGVVATPVTAKLTRLTPNTTYHFRVVIVAMDGTAIGADGTFTTSLVPSITRLSVTPKSFKPSRGATISYRDSVPARTTLTALRCVKSKKRKCTRYKKLAAFSRKDAAGLNKVKIKRRFGRRLLLPGSYRLQLTPRANGRTGKTVTTPFKVV